MDTRIAGPILRLIRRFLPVDRHKIAILPPSGAGSLGDQAMLDATSDAMTRFGKVVIMAHEEANTRVRARNVTYAPLTGGRLRDRIAALREVLTADTVVFLGADVIDGAYGGDCRRLGLLDLLLRAGLRGSCLGFSVSASPGAAAQARLRTLPPIPMHVRDRISVDRFRALTGRACTDVADVAFGLRPDARSDSIRTAIGWARAQRQGGRRVLAVNLGGWTLERMAGDGVAAVGACLQRWLTMRPDYAVLLLPHDFKPDPVGDVGPMQRLHRHLAAHFSERVHSIAPPFDAWDVKALAGEIDGAITGRMHFAIACLGMGTPAIGIVYQGKFEGLMDLFGLEGMLLSPEDAADPTALLACLARLDGALPDLRRKIRSRLPEVIALSEKNFSWL